MKRSLIILAVLVTLGMALSFNKGVNNWVTEQILNYRLVSALDKITREPIGDLLTDNIVAQATRGKNIYNAREAVYDEYLCGPVFNEKHRDQGRCFDVLYGHNVGEINYWYAKANVPVWEASTVGKFRGIMLERVRDYLSKPDNLKALYKQRKHSIILQLQAMGPRNQQMVIEELKDTRHQFLVYRPSDEKIPDDLFSDDGKRRLFIARRYAEGGQELLEAYADIAADLLHDLDLK